MQAPDDQPMSGDAKQMAERINSLHREVIRGCHSSEAEVHAALKAAWDAGRLLIAAKRDVRNRMGHGVWRSWLAEKFTGSERTAQRYMQLAKSVTTVTDLAGLSLRQAYQRLGLRIEAHGIAEPALPPAASGPGRAVRRLLAKLPTKSEFFAMGPTARANLLADLEPLLRRIRELFQAN